MRVGIDIRSLMEPRYSGVAEYTFNLLRALFDIDKSNEYILFYNSLTKPKLPEFNYSNVKIKGTRYPNKLFNLSLKFLNWPRVDKLLGGVDVFWLPNPQFICLSDQCKKVVTFHDLSFERYPEFFSFKRRCWHDFINPKKIAKDFDKVIAVSENTKRDLEDLYKISTNKIMTIYSGVGQKYQQINSESPELLKVKEKYQLPDRFVLYLGTLEPRKNLVGLIGAFSQVRSQVKLVIAGGQGWLWREIYQAVANSPKRAHIKLIGYVDAVDKPALYNLAELLVWPSFYEGFGLPCLEAMACGTPVVTSANSSLPEVTGGSAILINPYNLNEIATAIDEVLVSDELKQKLQEQGIEQARRFSWQECARKTLGALEQ